MGLAGFACFRLFDSRLPPHELSGLHEQRSYRGLQHGATVRVMESVHQRVNTGGMHLGQLPQDALQLLPVGFQFGGVGDLVAGKTQLPRVQVLDRTQLLSGQQGCVGGDARGCRPAKSGQKPFALAPAREALSGRSK